MRGEQIMGRRYGEVADAHQSVSILIAMDAKKPAW